MNEQISNILRVTIATIAMILLILVMFSLFDYVAEGPVASRVASLQEQMQNRWQNWKTPNQNNKNIDVTINIDQSALSQSSENLAKNAENLEIITTPIDPSVIFLGNGDFAEICPKELPENIHIVIAETKDYRLGSVDLEGMPCEVQFAIWPDSALTLSETDYLLINPPTDIMELYYVQAAAADTENFYDAAMPHAAGFFIRRGDKLVENKNLRALMIRQMGLQKKGLVIWDDEMPEDYLEITTNNAVPLAQIDYVISGNNIAEQWREIEAEAQNQAPNEKVFVVMEANGENIDVFKSLIKTP